MIFILQQMSKKDLFRQLGYAGGCDYAIKAWKLGESYAGLLVNVANLCNSAPEVEKAIQAEKITVSKARRIAAPIAKGEDASLWVQTAIELPQKQLEREVARTNPELAIRESIRPICANRNQIVAGASDALVEEFERIRALASKSLRKVATNEETIQFMAHITRKNSDTLDARTKHLVHRRDEGQCQEVTEHGKCLSRSFVDIHHIKPRSRGGSDELSNLITLCKFHHQFAHGLESKRWTKGRKAK